MFSIIFQIQEEEKKELQNLDIKIFDSEFREVHGPIEIYFNSQKYGYLVELPFHLPMANELLLLWFRMFNKTALKLIEGNEYVAFKLPEVPYAWFEFINQGQSVLIRQVEATSRIPDSIITNPKPEFHSKWESYEIINKQQFIAEVITKTQDFVENIRTINAILLESKSINQLLDIHVNLLRATKNKGLLPENINI